MIEKLTLEKEEIIVRDKSFKIVKPAKLEEIFEGDPFLEVDKFPFWFKIWEASIVLAHYIAGIEPPKKILEIGAGLGVVSIVAAGFGHQVLATDLDELSLKFVELSAIENNLSQRIKICKLDWRNPELSEKFDIIAGSEVISKKSLFDPLLSLFKNFLEEKGEILLAHSAERKRLLIPFLYKAQKDFDVLTSIRKLKSEDDVQEIILNRLIPKTKGN